MTIESTPFLHLFILPRQPDQLPIDAVVPEDLLDTVCTRITRLSKGILLVASGGITVYSGICFYSSFYMVPFNVNTCVASSLGFTTGMLACCTIFSYMRR